MSLSTSIPRGQSDRNDKTAQASSPGSAVGQVERGLLPGQGLSQRLRWVLIGWITVSTILNYMDRQTLSIVAPFLRDEFKLSNQQYSNIVTAFLISYTVMYTVGGRFVDWIGDRVGMASCIVWWSIATMLHSLAAGAFSLGVYRFVLGIGEPANYPAALKATTNWFGKAERGTPIAVYSSGSAIGAILAPPLIAWLMLRFGWRAAFVIPGALGLIWVVVWLRIYPRVGRRIRPEVPLTDVRGSAELRRQTVRPVLRKSSRWIELLRDRNVLALVLARFLADPVWYFYLFWTPEYLKRARGFSLADIGLYGWIPFVAAFAGGMFAGLASDWLIRRGWGAAAARRRLLYISAVFAPLAALTGWVHSAGAAIALIAVIAFICYVWFINTATLVSDLFPESVVGSVQGLIGTAGSGAGALFSLGVGRMLDRYSYSAVFLVAGSMHLLASLALWSLMRDRES